MVRCPLTLQPYFRYARCRYMLGSFQDEYGRTVESGRAGLNITRWEVGNEVMARHTSHVTRHTSHVTRHTSLFACTLQVDYEHGHTPYSYTLEYDAIVSGIWRLADPLKRLLFRCQMRMYHRAWCDL